MESKRARPSTARQAWWRASPVLAGACRWRCRSIPRPSSSDSWLCEAQALLVRLSVIEHRLLAIEFEVELEGTLGQIRHPFERVAATLSEASEWHAVESPHRIFAASSANSERSPFCNSMCAD